MTSAPILVIGGTGNVGSAVVAQLLRARLPVRVLARNPTKAAELLGTKVEVVVGDLDDPATLAPALRGIEVASLATAPGPQLAEQEANFIAAATAARLARVVKLSAAAIGVAKDVIHLRHAESEKLLEASGIESVVLRPVVFMSNLLMEAASIKAGTLPSVFGDGRISFIDPRDVAELMVNALVHDGHGGEVWELGGPEALSYDDLAAILTDALGRRIEHVRIDATAFREGALRNGLSDFVVEAILSAGEIAGGGHYLRTDEVVQRVLGRRATPFRDWAVRHREALNTL